MKTKNELLLLEQTADLYWDKVCHEADGFRRNLQELSWQQTLMIGGLTTAYVVADKLWQTEEGKEVLGINQEVLKNLLLELIQLKLEESVQTH